MGECHSIVDAGLKVIEYASSSVVVTPVSIFACFLAGGPQFKP